MERTIKICFFNHKGGVSKTTNVYHIGWMLTKLGKRVLLVDADSQCNLTVLALKGESNVEEFFMSQPNRNLKSALSQAFYAKPERISPFDCLEVAGNKNLFIIPGSFDISEYEASLAVSFQLNNIFPSMRNLPGAFNYLIEVTAEEYEADFVLIDLSPSLSAINQDILTSSDYFVIPVMPDYFSVMAIKSLASILPKWEKWANHAKGVLQSEEYPFPQTTPKFLGYTLNNYTARNREPARGYAEPIGEIKKAIEEDLIPKLRHANMVLEDDAYYEDLCLGKISDFNTLMVLAQQRGLAVFELEDYLKHGGKVKEIQAENVKHFGETFKTITEKILALTSDEPSYHAIAA